MWGFFRQRGAEDLKKVVSAFRCFLKVSDQIQQDLMDEASAEHAWRGGFGKAIHQLFNNWPTPNQSREFEKKMNRWQKKIKNIEIAYIQAFNDYLKQKHLNPQEIEEVLRTTKSLYRSETQNRKT